MITEFWSYLLVILISVFTAFTELLSRYKRPSLILWRLPSIFYILLNGVVAFFVYRYINLLGIKVYINNSNNAEISQVILAGTSSLLLLRSSFGIYKKGEEIVEIGFSGILKIIFDYCDRKFDQIFTEDNLKTIGKIMQNKDYTIDFEKAKTDLPVLCMKMMTNLSPAESKQLGIEVADLNQSDSKKSEFQFNKSKIIALGFIISEYTGIKLLEAAVNSLKDDIKIKEGEKDETEKLLDQLKNLKSSIISE